LGPAIRRHAGCRHASRAALGTRNRTTLSVMPLEGRLCPSGGYLFVDSLNTSNVLRYDETTGAFVDEFVKTNSGGLYRSADMDIGPDHNLYVSNGLFPNNGQAKNVLRYDGATGAFLGDFADSGQLTDPRGVTFGPDGNLYVADGSGPGRVLRYDGTTGAFLDEFVHVGSGGLSDPHAMLFGPDGNLYVIAGDKSEVLRYDGRTGDFIDVFVAPGQGGLPSGGLHIPTSMAFGPDGNFYVANSQVDSTSGGGILRFDGKTGAFIDTFVAPNSGGLKPLSIIFGPGGDLYVGYADTKILTADPHTSAVLRFNGTNGAFIDQFVPPDSGGLRYLSALIFSETDPVTRAYVGAKGPEERDTAMGITAASPAIITGRAVPGGVVMASPPPSTIGFDLAVAVVSRWDAPPQTTPAGAARPAVSAAETPLLAPPFDGNLPPSAQADSFQPALAPKAAADLVFTKLDAETSLAPFVDDLALTGWGSEGLTPVPLRG
jgi:streptogramin lyase